MATSAVRAAASNQERLNDHLQAAALDGGISSAAVRATLAVAEHAAELVLVG
jgi:hypothetical protein